MWKQDRRNMVNISFFPAFFREKTHVYVVQFHGIFVYKKSHFTIFPPYSDATDMYDPLPIVPIFYLFLIIICVCGQTAILVKKYVENRRDKISIR